MWQTKDPSGNITAQSPTYTGGTVSGSPNTSPVTDTLYPFSLLSSNTYTGSVHGVCGSTQYSGATTTISASGQSSPLVAVFTWQPAYPGEPPPPCVIVCQDCTASLVSEHYASFDASSTCTDGLGGNGVLPAGGTSTRSYRYIVATPAANGSVTVPGVSPAAACTLKSAPQTALIADASASYTATAYPITINLSGTTKDSNNQDNILVGQHCAASLSGIPSNCTVSNYQWSVSGTTFQTWSADTPPFPIIVGGIQIGIIPENPDATYEVDGPGPLTNPTAGWYWNDLAKGTGNSTQETVSCTATVTPPAGQGSAFTVSATQPITVWTPGWTATGEGASAVVNNTYIGGSGFWLHAGPGPLDFGTTNGMTWTATLSPPPAPILFRTGSLAIVQIITSYDCGFVTNTTPSVSFPYVDNGQTGLDGSWPYPWYTSSPNFVGGIEYISGDSPGVPLAAAQSAHDNISFEDYLMYCPPSSVQYVPVAKYIWSADMSATLPATGNWINFPGLAGTVTDAQRTGNFLPSNEFPSWTQIVQ